MVVSMACGGTPSTATSPAVTPTVASPTLAATTPLATASATRQASQAGAQPGEVQEDAVLVRLGDDPPTLDPHLSVDTSSSLYIVEIYGGLVTIDQNLEIAPDLARDWSVSDDGRTYTFFLREDAKFHNGDPVTAQDFKWSMERVSDPETQSPVVDVFFGDIVGFQDKIEGRATSIEGIKVINDHTLSITIDAPKAFFLSKLTYPTGFVLDQESVEGNPTWFETPNGTGPFRLEEYVPGEVIRLQRKRLLSLGAGQTGGGQVYSQRRRLVVDVRKRRDSRHWREPLEPG